MFLKDITDSDTLKDLFVKMSEILLVFIHGSVAKGRTRIDSDIDIAVLFNKKPSFEQLFKIKDEVSENLNKEIDLTVLNDASPVIKMQVLKNGKLLFERNKGEYARFFVNTVKVYDDLKTSRLVIEKNVLKGRIYA